MNPEGLHRAAMSGVATMDELRAALIDNHLPDTDETAMLIAHLTQVGYSAGRAGAALREVLNAYSDETGTSV